MTVQLLAGLHLHVCVYDQPLQIQIAEGFTVPQLTNHARRAAANAHNLHGAAAGLHVSCQQLQLLAYAAPTECHMYM